MKNTVIFSSKKDTTYLIRSPLIALNLLIYKILKKLYSEATLIEQFWTFRHFFVHLKHIVSETGMYPSKKPTGQNSQLLLNIFRVLIDENNENFQKLTWKAKICLKN